MTCPACRGEGAAWTPEGALTCRACAGMGTLPPEAVATELVVAGLRARSDYLMQTGDHNDAAISGVLLAIAREIEGGHHLQWLGGGR